MSVALSRTPVMTAIRRCQHPIFRGAGVCNTSAYSRVEGPLDRVAGTVCLCFLCELTSCIRCVILNLILLTVWGCTSGLSISLRWRIRTERLVHKPMRVANNSSGPFIGPSPDKSNRPFVGLAADKGRVEERTSHCIQRHDRVEVIC